MCWRVWPRFSHLLYDPKSTWVSRDLEAEDLPPVVTDDKEAIQNTKGERRHREEVHRCNRLAMIAQEGEPALRRIGSSRSAPKPSRDRRLGEIETQLEQLPVNARRSPRWILRRHTKDQSSNLRAHTSPAALSLDKMLCGCEINSLRDFLRQAFCYELEPCSICCRFVLVS